jgi:hypothetical protein
MKDNKIGAGFICRDCAELGGAIWPVCHVATFHTGECDSCGEKKSLCHTNDYDWPNRPELELDREL